MLVSSSRGRPDRDEDGAVLVTVVVVMFVGFVVAIVVAASVLFTIGANTRNTDRTQAFITAESGRDAARAMLSGTCVSPTGSDTDPAYEYAVYSVQGARPDSSAEGAIACPSVESDYVVIRSTGTGPDGSQVTIESVYPWEKRREQQVGGVLAYFAGGVTSTVLHHTGDFVVRAGSFSCTEDSTLNGDLYVVEGTFSLGSDCTINGSVYVSGDATDNSHGATITGLLKSGGDVALTANGTTVGARPAAGPDTGGIEAVGSVTLGGSTGVGNVYGVLRAGASIAPPTPPWLTFPTAEANTTIPAFDPALPLVKAVTAWVHLDGNSPWRAATVNACALDEAQLATLLSMPGDRLIVDYRPCPVSTEVSVSLGTVTVNRDAVFIFPAAKRMDVSVDGSVDGSGQLFFIHEDADRGDRLNGETRPTCGSAMPDAVGILSSAVVTAKVMFYTPCRLTGAVRASFAGQLYAGESSIAFGNGASYTCATMSWPVALEKLGCRLTGEGEDAIIETAIIQGLGSLIHQREQ